MRVLGRIALGLVAGVLGAHAAKAGLLNDMVDGSYYYPDSLTNAYDAGTGYVSPSVAFTLPSGYPNTIATVTDTQIILTFDGPGGFEAAAFSGVVITDLTNADITNVTLDTATTLSGFSSSDLSFTSSSVSMNLQGLTGLVGTETVVVDVSTETSTPEPFSISVLATGLIGLGFARSRKA